MYASSADGTEIAVTRAGAGPVLVLIDPAGAFHGMRPMTAVVPELARYFSVATYDRRGRGDSGDNTTARTSAPEREVEDLAAVIDLVGGQAYVYAFSSGSAVALAGAAAGLPIPGLALLEPPFLVDAQRDVAFEAELRRLLDVGERGAAVEFFYAGVGMPPEFVAELRRNRVWPDLEALADTFVYDLEIMSTMTSELFSRVSPPVLVVSSTGSDDYLRDNARDIATRLPAGSHRELDGEWHGVDEQQLAELLAARFG